MKSPISVHENGGVSIFSSVAEAESYMEPIDVEHGEYIVTDADGKRLSLSVVVEDVPLFWGLWRGRVKKVRVSGSE